MDISLEGEYLPSANLRHSLAGTGGLNRRERTEFDASQVRSI
jgi:hypothetical protein